MTNPESRSGTLPKFMPTTLTYHSSALGMLWVRGLNAGDMFRVAERFPELANADDSAVMRVVAEESVTHDPICEQPLSEPELARLNDQDLAAIASLMCEIDEVDRPDVGDPISIFASFVKHKVLKLSEMGRALRKSVGSSILSTGTIDRIAQSYAGGILSNRFIDKASERASQLSALASPPIGVPANMHPQRMESIARDTLEANLQILRRLSNIADVAADVEVDRAAQQQKDSRNLKIAMASLIVSVVLSLVTIGVTYYGVYEADTASADSSRQYQQTLDLQRQQLTEARSLSADLRQQLAILRAEISTVQTSTGELKFGTPSKAGVHPTAGHSTH